MDMYDYQIVAILDCMSSTQILKLSSSDTISTDQFISSAKATSQEKGQYLQKCSHKIECSVQELLTILYENAMLPTPSSNDTPDIAQTKKGIELLLYEYILFLHFCVR